MPARRQVLNSREEEVRKRRGKSKFGGSKIMNRMIPLLGILMLFLAIWAWPRLSLIYWVILLAAISSIFLLFKFHKPVRQKEKEGELKEVPLKTEEKGISPQEEIFKAEKEEKDIRLSPEIFPEEKKVLDIQEKVPEVEGEVKNSPPPRVEEEKGTDLREILLKLEGRIIGMEEMLLRLEEKTVHI
jgi:hypothetical protein